MDFRWKDEYSVGNQLLDQQHKRLLALCESASKITESDSPNYDLHLLLHELMEYAREHFRSEENLLKVFNYPQLYDQMKEHAEYEQKLTNLLMAATFGDMQTKQTIQFLLDWWLHHILGSDRLYIPYLNQS